MSETEALNSALIVLEILRLVKTSWNNPDIALVEKTAEFLSTKGDYRVGAAIQVIRSGNLLDYEFYRKGERRGYVIQLRNNTSALHPCKIGDGGMSKPQEWYGEDWTVHMPSFVRWSRN